VTPMHAHRAPVRRYPCPGCETCKPREPLALVLLGGAALVLLAVFFLVLLPTLARVAS
jgi:type II secretory pathway component PulM